MKRPLALVGFTYLLALAAAVALQKYALLMGALCLSVFMLLLVLQRHRRYPIISLFFLTAAIAFGSFHAYTEQFIRPPSSYAGKSVQAEGVVCQEPEYANGQYRYVLRIEGGSLPGVSQSFQARIYSREKLAERPGDRIAGIISFYIPSESAGFDSRAALLADGVCLYGYFAQEENIRYTGREKAEPYFLLLDLRKELNTQIARIFPEEYGLIQALILGNTSSLSPQLQESFRRIGVSHLLVISGFHMAVVMRLLLMLFRWFIPFRRLRTGVLMAAVFCYMGVACFQPSVSRSGIMCLMMLSGGLFLRRADSLNSLGFAALLLLLENPWAAADIGFLLSVSACLGMILLEPVLEKALLSADRFGRKGFKEKLRISIAGIAGGSLAASLFTLPVSVLAFGTIALAGPLANLFLMYPVSFLIELALPVLLLSFLPGIRVLLLPFESVIRLLCRYVYGIGGILSEIPFARVSFTGRKALFWIACCFLLWGITVWIMKRPRLFRVTGLLSFILFLLSVFSWQISLYNIPRLVIAPSGGGISTLFLKNGEGAVIGGSGYSETPLRRAIQSEGISRLRAVWDVSGSYEEENNLGGILEAYPAEALIVGKSFSSSGRLLRSLEQAEEIFLLHEQGEGMLLEDGLLEYKYGFARLTCRGTTILYWTKVCREDALPAGWENCDCIIFEKLPKELENLHPSFAILCLSSQERKRAAGREFPFPAAAVENEALEIRFIGERRIEWRRG